MYIFDNPIYFGAIGGQIRKNHKEIVKKRANQWKTQQDWLEIRNCKNAIQGGSS